MVSLPTLGDVPLIGGPLRDQLMAPVARSLAADRLPFVQYRDPPGDPPTAVIAPQAGYRYSGPTAGAAYRAVAARRGEVERVVVAGPAHRVPLGGVGVSTARGWRTPAGSLTSPSRPT